MKKAAEIIRFQRLVVLNDRNRYALKLRNIKGWSGFALFEPYHFTIHSPQNRFFESDQNRYTLLCLIEGIYWRLILTTYFRSAYLISSGISSGKYSAYHRKGQITILSRPFSVITKAVFSLSMRSRISSNFSLSRHCSIRSSSESGGSLCATLWTSSGTHFFSSEGIGGAILVI